MALSRTGIPESDREARVGAAESVSDPSARVTLSVGDGGPVVISDAALLRDGEFLRQGGDLVIRGADGVEVVVQGYFAARPTLTTTDGAAALSPGLVDSFLSAMAPGQYAQAAGSAQSPIGQVDELKGEAFAVRADGTRVQLAKGDAVFEGDVVETGGGASAIRMVFVDKTMFALGSDARLALDKLVFDPSHLSGSSQFSILKGVFIFSSGEIAKTDNTEMTVITPVAAIGIRGTEVAGRVDGANSQFTIIDGVIEVTTQAGSVTLDGAAETTMVSGIDAAPSAPLILSPAQYGAAYGGVAGVAPAHFTIGGGGAGDDAGLDDPGTPDLGPGGDEDRARGLDDGGSGRGNSLSLEAISQLSSEDGVGTGVTPGVTGPFGGLGTPDAVWELAREISETVEYQLAAALTLEPTPEPSGPGGAAGETADDDAVVDSPYRTEIAGPDVFENLYVPSEPYGTPEFTTDGDGADPATGASAGSIQGDGIDENTDNGGYAEAPVPQDEAPVPEAVPVTPPPSPAEFVLTLSNDLDNDDLASHDPADSFVLTGLQPGDSSLVTGNTMQLPGVSSSAAVDFDRDDAGHLTVRLNGTWDDVKNVFAESDQAAGITISNFVHADVMFGNGGDSNITVETVKRGFILTGDGNDLVDIKAFVNVSPNGQPDSAPRRIDISTGDGDDIVIYEGSSSYLGTSTVGLSELTFTAGAGTDTLRLTGPDTSFDLTTARFDLTGVERIDISAVADGTLSLNSLVVAAITDGENALTDSAGTLVVDGTVDFNGETWTKSDTEISGFESYAVYDHSSGVRVVADPEIAVA